MCRDCAACCTSSALNTGNDDSGIDGLSRGVLVAIAVMVILVLFGVGALLYRYATARAAGVAEAAVGYIDASLLNF